MNNISKETTTQINETIFSLDFIDNANWIFNSLDDLKSILSVADNFYKIIRVAINKNKSKLLSNTTNYSTTITINFRDIPI